VRAVIGFPAILLVDAPLIVRALEIYEVDRLDFAEAYLVASAEATGVKMIASFDRPPFSDTSQKRRRCRCDVDASHAP
jgi:predicted nucleic-acid-binding protein